MYRLFVVLFSTFITTSVVSIAQGKVELGVQSSNEQIQEYTVEFANGRKIILPVSDKNQPSKTQFVTRGFIPFQIYVSQPSRLQKQKYTLFLKKDSGKINVDFNSTKTISVESEIAEISPTVCTNLENTPDDDVAPQVLLAQINKRGKECYQAIDPDDLSEELVNQIKKEIQYYNAANFYELYSNLNVPTELLPIWIKTIDSLLITAPLQNPSAIGSFNYGKLQAAFLKKKRETVWKEATKDQTSFWKEWYPEYQEDYALEEFSQDPTNSLTERIILKQFGGVVLEDSYASLFFQMIGGRKENAEELFKRFKQSFPNSFYLEELQPTIDQFAIDTKRSFTNEMVILPDGSKFKEFNEVLSLIKGKSSLIYLWGTWSNPSLEAIQKAQKIIQKQNASIDQLYIAVNDNYRTENWKKIIPNYGLAGKHLLASKALSQDIFTKLEIETIPAIIFVDSNGNYSHYDPLSMDSDVFTKMLETLK